MHLGNCIIYTTVVTYEEELLYKSCHDNREQNVRRGVCGVQKVHRDLCSDKHTLKNTIRVAGRVVIEIFKVAFYDNTSSLKSIKNMN